MSDLAAEARKLYAKRDKLERELKALDAQLNALRSRYMSETNTYGIHPTAFRREVETVTKRAA